MKNRPAWINTDMKFIEILEWVQHNKLMGSYDIKDEMANGIRHIELVRRDEKETVAGSMSIDGNTIINMEIDEKDYRDVAQDMIQYVCDLADRQNTNLTVDAKTADTRIKSFLSLAGFDNGDDNILIRRSGAARII